MGQFNDMNLARGTVDFDEGARRQCPRGTLYVDHAGESELAGHHGGV
jgi:hypothetical protein